MSAVTTVILAGGEGRRIGGDKALQRLRGKPLIDWVFAAVRPQSDEVLISANEQHGAYAHCGCRIFRDITPGAGPLAGLQAAMLNARNDWVASVPCDTPFLPADLIPRLLAAAVHADGAVAVAGGRRHPTIAVYRKSVLPKLDAYLAAGGRKVGGWLDTLHTADVPFDDAAAFVNVNTREELGSL